MNKSEKRTAIIKRIIAAILILWFVIDLFGITNPPRRPAWFIKAHMLALTPIGTDMEDVIEFVENKKKWEVMYISYTHGITKNEISDKIEAGEKSIKIHYGEYQSVLIFSVLVYYAFDEESKLIGVWVDKEVDII